MPDLNQLIREGIFDIELGVANPRTNGVSAGEGAIGYATDNSRWVKVGAGDTDWKRIILDDFIKDPVLDATERLALNTPAGTYVEQTGVPNVIFFQTGADASDAASWIALPASKEADGSFIVDMALANVSGTVPDVNQLGVSGGVPSIGDGITPNGRKVTMNTKPAGMAYMVSTKDSNNNVIVTVRTTTGNAAIRWWDGTVEEGGDGSGDGVADNITFTKAVPADGSAWSGPSPKEIYVWSCTDAATPTDPTQVGDITYLSCINAFLTTLDVSGLTALHTLDCYDNNLTTLDVSGLTALTTLACSSNNLTTLDVSGLTALTTLYCDINNLTTLDVSGLTALTTLACSSNNLTTLDVSGLTLLTTLYCDTNNLTTLRALDVVLSFGHHIHGGSKISDNNLDAAALDQFYTDLAEDLSNNGIIYVANNPGTTGDDPTIATAKGYTITGS